MSPKEETPAKGGWGLRQERRVVLGRVAGQEKRSCPAAPAQRTQPSSGHGRRARWLRGDVRTGRKSYLSLPPASQHCAWALYSLQLVSLLKPPCLQGLRKYWLCLTSSTNVKHKWSWVDGSSPLKHAFETLQSSKLAYIPCAVIHSLLFCISVCFNEVVQCSSSKSKTYDAP